MPLTRHLYKRTGERRRVDFREPQRERIPTTATNWAMPLLTLQDFLGGEPMIRLFFCFLFSHPILFLKPGNQPVEGSFNVIKPAFLPQFLFSVAVPDFISSSASAIRA